MHRLRALTLTTLLATIPNAAHAEEPKPMPAAQTQENGVAAALITMGVALLGPSYAYSVHLAKDSKALYVPVLGPYLALTIVDTPRGDFAALGALVLLADAAVQTAGAALIIGGIHEIRLGGPSAPVTITPTVSAGSVGVVGRW